MRWSPQQIEALDVAGRWLRDSSSQVLRLFGVAGTGKSTIARHLVENARGQWLFAAYTGKAAHVMRQMGCAGASTIHSLIYRPSGSSRKVEEERLRTELSALSDEDEHERRRILQQISDLNSRRPAFSVYAGSRLADRDVAGVVVDEVSMVDRQLAEDLLSFKKKVLVLGDPEQLPPVFGGGYFTEHRPDIMLTEVHRQARESGVLRLATHVREGKSLRTFESTDDARVVWRGSLDREELAMTAMSADQVLVGLNATRRAANARHRALLGRASQSAERGDRVICLRNDREQGLFNGSQWTVDACDVPAPDSDVWTLRLRSDEGDRAPDDLVEVASWSHHMTGRHHAMTEMSFGRLEFQEFDWAYAMTVHKAQGSQWNEVLLFDQTASMPGGSSRRWLYTGITRAAKRVTVIS